MSPLRAVWLMLLLAVCGPTIGSAQSPSATPSAADSVVLTRAAAPDTTTPSSSGAKLPHRERKVTRQISELEPVVEWQWGAILATALAMIGAILLTLPVALAYRVTKPAEEYDPSVMHSSIILAPTIAGILLVIQGSLAMAFSLAGVATAVRFRNSLKDTNDAVYVFVAIAIGLAAGGQALDIGLAISIIFSALMLLLSKSPFRNTGNPRHAARGNHRHHPDPSAPTPTPEGGTVRPPRWADPGRNGSHLVEYVTVLTSDPERARSTIEPFLERATKRWRLQSTTREGDKDVALLYAVRCRKRMPEGELLEELRDLALSEGFSLEAPRRRPPGPAATRDAQPVARGAPSAGT